VGLSAADQMQIKNLELCGVRILNTHEPGLVTFQKNVIADKEEEEKRNNMKACFEERLCWRIAFIHI